MTEEVLELLRTMAGPADEDLLRALCRSACAALDGALREGVTAQDCPEPYRLAAAWTALDWLRAGQGLDGLTALSAGNMSLRRDGGGTRLARRALELMAPWVRDRAFAFQGVKG